MFDWGFGSLSEFQFHYLPWVQRARVRFCAPSLGSSLRGALCLADLTLWHPTEPCFLLISLTFILVTALSVCLFCNHSLQQLATTSILISLFQFSSHCLVLSHACFVIIHSPPPVKRIRLVINARLDKAGTSRVREEGLTDPDSFVIG